MTTSSNSRERRDWTLIIFLLPIGIILMLIAGQIAIRVVPSWRVDGGMQSSLDPESAAKSEPGQVQPISFDILTPMGWLESFLTPGPGSASDGIIFPPFIVLEPSETPSTTATATSSATAVTPTATPTATTATASSTPTKKPKDDDTPTPTPTSSTCTDPLASNYNQPLPCLYPSPEPLVGSSTATPSEYNYGAPDGSVGSVPNGRYIVINLTANPIIVNGPFDTGYDLVYYERDTGVDVDMDRVIISISSDGSTYYVVFDWGDGDPDNNSNVGDVAGSENDNQNIPYTELYNNTGILIDVDNAPSNPPIATYQWLAVQAPTPPPSATPPNNSTDGADVDSVQVLP